MPPGAVHYYIETDGKLFLIEDGGTLRLPRVAAEVPFAFTEKQRVGVGDATIVYCHPKLPKHPDEWAWKDDVWALPKVDPVVLGAIHRRMPRLVAKVVVRKADHVLLVKPSRGFFTGRWGLPGGYVDYGESPEDAAVRETLEEVGVRIRLERLLIVHNGYVREKGLHFVTHVYEASAESEAFVPKSDEIEDVRWFPLDECLSMMGSWSAREGIERLLKERRP
ncbi:MAG: NUDIX hydrolase [Methanobacteriota archaeon]